MTVSGLAATISASIKFGNAFRAILLALNRNSPLRLAWSNLNPFGL